MTHRPTQNAVGRKTRLVRLAQASPADELGCVAALAHEAATGALVVSELAGSAVSLGRFQRAGSSGASRECRRLTGGRSTLYGDGIVSLTALLPRDASWLDPPAPQEAARIVNRLVRGLLHGLRALGLAASYPGRDFACVNGRRVAALALSREAEGTLLFQAIVGVSRPYTSAQPEPVFPGLPAPPEPTSLARELGRAPEREPLASALAQGFAETFALELEPASAPERARVPALADDALAGLVCAGPVATPIGALEAHVAVDARENLERVRLRGDWMATPASVDALERELVGLCADDARVAERCARWLRDPAALVLGLVDPQALPRALVASARAARATR